MWLRWAGLVTLLGAAALAVAAVVVVGTDRDDRRLPSLGVPDEIVGPDPLAFEESRTAAYERAAAFGLSHVLFAKSPGGVATSARRTASFRPLVDEAAAGSGIDADLLEAIVLLESAGRPNVVAGSDVANAAGLTQILAETATNFLGMNVDLTASRRLTGMIEDARQRGNVQEVELLQAERQRVDARFDPAQALAGSVRYLTEARGRLGRDDLAVVSYHMGIGNLESVLRAYSGVDGGPIDEVVDDRDLSYARAYFDSSPLRHREAWERLASFGDDSQTYYWRVLAAEAIMRLYREDPAALRRLARLHGLGPSAELVLHPPELTRRFAEPRDLETARAAGILRPLPDEPQRTHYRIGRNAGQSAAEAGGDPSAYRSLRPRALRMLAYLAAEVHELSGAEQPLVVTSAAYDEASARRLSVPRPTPSHASLHATGFSFDIRRRYESGEQAAAFQWTLERLETLGLIAWTRGKAVIHVSVSRNAQ